MIECVIGLDGHELHRSFVAVPRVGDMIDLLEVDGEDKWVLVAEVTGVTWREDIASPYLAAVCTFREWSDGPKEFQFPDALD